MRNDTYIGLQINEWCPGDCPVGATLSMKVQNTANPSTLDANDPIFSFKVFVARKTLEFIQIR